MSTSARTWAAHVALASACWVGCTVDGTRSGSNGSGNGSEATGGGDGNGVQAPATGGTDTNGTSSGGGGATDMNPDASGGAGNQTGDGSGGNGDSQGTGGDNGSEDPPGTDDCTPDSSGGFVLENGVVYDERWCLSWTPEHAGPSSYADAEAHCAGLDLGGYDDWRLPTAGEAASLILDCSPWPPVVSEHFSSVASLWTTTLVGQEDRVCGAGLDSKQFYSWGRSGGQTFRCVRGPGMAPDRDNCGTNQALCD